MFHVIEALDQCGGLHFHAIAPAHLVKRFESAIDPFFGRVRGQLQKFGHGVTHQVSPATNSMKSL
jgi:hypothetical protein